MLREISQQTFLSLAYVQLGVQYRTNLCFKLVSFNMRRKYLPVITNIKLKTLSVFYIL